MIDIHVFTSLVIVAIKLKNKRLDNISKEGSTSDITKWHQQYLVTKTWQLINAT